jgi:hypothetical protein
MNILDLAQKCIWLIFILYICRCIIFASVLDGRRWNHWKVRIYNLSPFAIFFPDSNISVVVLPFRTNLYHGTLYQFISAKGYFCVFVFCHNSPEVYALDLANRKTWKKMTNLAQRMCRRNASTKDRSLIWLRPLTNWCYMRREPIALPPMCGHDDDPMLIPGRNVLMKACITHPNSKSFLSLFSWKIVTECHCLLYRLLFPCNVLLQIHSTLAKVHTC